MEIREILPWDEKYFCDMVNKFYKMPAVAHQIPEHHAKKTFDLLIKGSPYARCFVGTDENGIPHAYCLCSITWSNEAGGICVWLEEIMVEDELQGKGVGKMLIETVKNSYPNAARFRLEITEQNKRAKKLYLSLGFETLEYNQMILDTK